MFTDVVWKGTNALYRVLENLIRAAPEVTADALNEHAINIQAQAKKNLTDLPAVDTGRLRASVMIEIFDRGLARRIGSDLTYAPVVEFGSRPHFPPLDPIRAWCRRHGIPESAAYPIALKIAKRGTPAKPWLFPAFESERPNFEEAIKNAWHALSRELK